MSNETRQCFICMEEMQVVQAEEGDWVSPCRCTGTIRWVHQQCIRRWVLMQEKTSYSGTACSQCLTPYRLTPEKSCLITALQLWYKKLYPCVRFWAGCTVVSVFLETGCTVVGMIAVGQVYGIEKTFQMIDEVPPLEAISNMYLVGASLLVFGFTPFSDLFLKGLRIASRLPVLGYVFPSNVPRPRALYEPQRRTPAVRSLTAALLLPSCAKLLGHMLFSDLNPMINRVFMGGAVFLTVKGALSMYLQQKLMHRRCSLVVHDYREE